MNLVIIMQFYDKLYIIVTELYYMMNNVKYAKIFTKKLNYIPDSSYFDIEKDIQAYIIINNTINLADFISYEINNIIFLQQL